MSNCGFTPDWCKSLVAIPEMTCDAPYTMKKLPQHLAQSTPTETLRQAYGFDDSSQNIMWSVVPIHWGNSDGEVQEPTLDIFCHDVTEKISADGISGTYIATYPQFLSGDGGIHKSWVIAADELCCDGEEPVDGSSRCLLIGPAPQPAIADPILPTPTFVPQLGGRGGGSTITVGSSLSNLMQENDGELEAAPANECDDGTMVLVHKKDANGNPYVDWECLAKGNCCANIHIVDLGKVTGTFAVGTIVEKVSADGSFKNGDKVTVAIPSFTS